MSVHGERSDEVLEQLRQLIDDTVVAKTERHRTVSAVAASLSIAEMSELILGARRMREGRFNMRLFGEPAWDILLELHIAHHQARAVTLDVAATFGDTPSSTGLRCISVLEREGLIERGNNSADRRRPFIALTADGLASLDDYVAAFGQWAGTRAATSNV